jgi:hypothetical protein
MYKIIKGKEVQAIESRNGLEVYLANGWKLVGEGDEPKVEAPAEPTKKELQEQLDAKGIEYSPRDNKDALKAKLEGGQPTDNFDDGLLKG